MLIPIRKGQPALFQANAEVSAGPASAAQLRRRTRLAVFGALAATRR
jgi:hypothetical protein